LSLAVVVVVVDVIVVVDVEKKTFFAKQNFQD